MVKTVLIVEDDRLNMKLFTDLLQTDGYNTVQSFDGADILETVKTHAPDLIIMDIRLPDRSGFHLTKLLKDDDNLKHIPVIAVTAFIKNVDEKSIREAGFTDYLPKPISVPRFLEIAAENLA